MKRITIALALGLAALIAAPPAGATQPTKARKTTAKTSASRPPAKKKTRAPLALVWHVETLDGEIVSTSDGDVPINPASVVKVATSWWALETLGPAHRFETRVFARGTVDAKRGVLDGDLVVEGGGDPDFQAENAFMVAAALNRLEIRRVTGALVVGRRFWMGWEDGSAGRQADPDRRAALMAARLKQALDPGRWDRATRSAWMGYAFRRGFYAKNPPRVSIAGPIRIGEPGDEAQPLVVHRSKPLVETLRRFCCFSNNDIERVGDEIGPASDLASRLAEAIGASPGGLQFQTTSGLGENRITPRQAVRMMREFRKTGERLGRPVESLLPVGGCDPGTVTRFFPSFAEGPAATALVAKTGTLTATDGGVSVLAGFLQTAQGELVFCVAAPRAAGRLKRARVEEQRWLLELAARRGGTQPRTCAPPLAAADDDAEIVFSALGSGGAVAATPARPSGSAAAGRSASAPAR